MTIPARYVLDTNIITAILRKETRATSRLSRALASNAEFLICPVVFYETYRGLLHRDAKDQLDFFLEYVATFTWEDLRRQDWQAAAHLWSRLRAQGQQGQDADLLIGAYAARRGAVLVTDNEKHFALTDVPVENWRR